jgi:hypothetical protein
VAPVIIILSARDGRGRGRGAGKVGHLHQNHHTRRRCGQGREDQGERSDYRGETDLGRQALICWLSEGGLKAYIPADAIRGQKCILKKEEKKGEELGKRKVNKEIGRKLQRVVLRSQNYLFQLHLWLRLQLAGTCGFS